jgi:uncharacterized protein
LRHRAEGPSSRLELQSVPGPVPVQERVAALDALRGVALLGILPMNIQAFAMIGAAYLNPTAYGDLRGANYWVWFVSHLLAEQKFMAIFSMLFGAGIVLMTSHIEASGGRPVPFHYRRMGWLILFGLLHGYLLWYGDILLTYGLCGLLAFTFHKLAARHLIFIGLAFIAVTTLIDIYFAWWMLHWPPGKIEAFTRDMWLPTPGMVRHELGAYCSGWLGEMHQRFHDNTVLQVKGFIALSFWRVEGLMLIGMALYKLGIFTARRSAMLYWVFIVVGLLIGIPIISYGTMRDFSTGWRVRQSLFLNYQYNYWASLPVSLAWVGIVMLACRSRSLKGLTKPISAVGRMAFTNYILDTLICTSIFYGFGMGLFGKVSRVGQIEVVLTIWVIQLAVSPIWLRYFRFGPLEWLWRSLTYWKLQPFRQCNAAWPASLR